MSTVQISRATSTVEVSATRPRVEVGTPSLVQHNDLDGRDAADAHPIGAITGLLPLPTADGSRWAVSHPGGANPPAWSNQAAWLDRANVFASGTVALPEIAIGGSTSGLFSPNANSVSISVGAAERMRITNASHAFGIGRDLSTVTTLSPFSGIHYHGPDGNNVRHGIWCYKNGVGGAVAQFVLGAMQGTATAPAATASSDLANMLMGGHDGSAYATAEAIRFQASSTWTGSNREFQISLYSCANGATGATERVRVASNGQTYFQNGSASAPGVSFFSSTGMGFYRAGADTLGITTGGIERARVASAGLMEIMANAAGYYPAAAPSMGGRGLSIYGQDSVSAGLQISTIAERSIFIGRRANGTASSPTALAANDLLFDFSVQGYDGTAFSGGRAIIYAQSSEAWTNTAHGTMWRFLATANGTTSAAEILRLDGSLITAYKSITLTDAINIAAGTTTGTKIGTATSQKIGFWNATPIIQPAAAAQAAPAAQGQATLTDSTGGTASTTLAAITAGASYAQSDMTAVKNAIASIAARLAEVKTDVANIKTFQNAARTALVNTGLIKGAA